MALLLVLMVVALLTTLLTELAFSTLVDLRLTETFRDGTKAYYLAKGGVNAGTMLLREDRNRHDSLDEPWHQGVVDYPAGSGTVTVRIEDLGGKLAINSLVRDNNPQTVAIDRFYRFFSAMRIDHLADPAELTAALIDWLDSGEDSYRTLRVDGREISVAGAEASYYQGLSRPYPCKNGPLHSLEELALVRGFSPEVIQRVAPHLTANGDLQVNINTASREVLMALDPLIDRQAAEKLEAFRGTTPIDNLAQLEGTLSPQAYSALRTLASLRGLATTSRLFRISSEGTVNDGRRRIVAEVEKASGKLLVSKVD